MDPMISDFIRNNNLLNLAVADGHEVYCANCYYAFDDISNCLIIKSSPYSKHIKLASVNPNTAVSIAKDSSDISLIKGVQIKSYFRKSNDSHRDTYYNRYPFAILNKGEIYILEILWAKYTDNQRLSSSKLTYTKI